jgi:BlaI family penicillinase repressor
MGRAGPQGLSRRERQIMDVVYRRKGATAAEVWGAIPSPPGYSAVRSLLRILEGKGFLNHQKRGRKYRYLPTIPQRQARQAALRQLVDTYFEGSARAAMAALIRADRKRLTETEYRRLIEECEP